MKVALRIGGFVIAAAIFWFLLSRIGVDAVLAQLRHVGPGFVWILVLHAASIAVAGLPWWVLLPRDVRPSPVGAMTSRFFAQGAAAVLPLFGLGGELVRLLWLRRGERASGVAAIIVDRLLYAASNATMLAIGLVGLLYAPALPADYTRAAAIGIGLIVVVVVVVSVIAHRGVGVRVHRLVHRMRKKLEHDTQFGEDVDAHVTAMLRLRARGPWIGWALHLVSRALIGVEIVVGFWLLGVTLSWDQALVFAALPVIMGVSGALVPSQLGVLEGAQALVAASYGLDAATAVAVVLLLRLRQLAGAAILGPILLMRRRGIVTAAASGA